MALYSDTGITKIIIINMPGIVVVCTSECIYIYIASLYITVNIVSL